MGAPEEERAGHGGEGQRQPQQGQPEDEVRRQVAVVRAAIEEHRLGLGGGAGRRGPRDHAGVAC